MPSKISTVLVVVQTIDDNKEDARFDLDIKQGVNNILELREGAGINWDDGNVEEFNRDLDVDVTGESIEVVAALQDGPWGRRNHWNSHIEVIIRTTDGQQLSFGGTYAFRTASRRPRHAFNLGIKRFASHGVRFAP